MKRFAWLNLLGLLLAITFSMTVTSPVSARWICRKLVSVNEEGLYSLLNSETVCAGRLTQRDILSRNELELVPGAMILNKSGGEAEKVKISGTSKKAIKLEILEGFARIECPEVATEAEQEGKTLLGSYHLRWKGCKTSAGGTCTGLGDEAGLVLALGTFHVVLDKVLTEGSLGLGILFLLEQFHFICSVLFVDHLVLVKGDVLCLLTPLTPSKAITIKCEGEKGDPKETVYWNENGEKVELGGNSLLSSENGGAFRMSNEAGEVEGTTSEEIELMD